MRSKLGISRSRIPVQIVVMSISGVSDILDAPEGLDGLDDGLTEDVLIGDPDEDSSLLDAALGDVSTGDKDPLALTPSHEDPVDSNIQDEANDSLQVEEDPVGVWGRGARQMWRHGVLISAHHVYDRCFLHPRKLRLSRLV